MLFKDLAKALLIKYFDIVIMDKNYCIIKDKERFNYRDAWRIYGELKVETISIHNELNDKNELLNIAYVELIK